jgi:hypothetical protein
MEIKRIGSEDRCSLCEFWRVGVVENAAPYFRICDDCLEKIVKCAGWEVEKEGEAPKIEWFGEPGHFCAADACVFHLHTHVNGKWCVSTVGEWYPRGTPRQANRGPETIGSDRLYETMVFRVIGKDIDLSELEMAPYNDREAAQKGHMALVEKYGGMP